MPVGRPRSVAAGRPSPALHLPVVPARPGRTRRNLPREEARIRITQAARALFADRGYDKTTMEDIARLVGLSRARLYRLFPGRHEVVEAIIAEDAKALAGELLLEFARAESGPAKIRAMVRVFFRFVEARRKRERALGSLPGTGDSVFADLMTTVRDALADTFAQEVATIAGNQAVGRGELRLMAHAVIAAAEGAAAAWAQGPPLDLDRSVDIVTGVAMRALNLPPERPAR